MMNFLLVGLGGLIGSVLRYGVYLLVDKYHTTGFPMATLLVNVIGSFLLGALFALSIKADWFNEQYRLLLMVGLCGSFTTFSTFAIENYQMFKDGLAINSALYMLASVILSIAFVFVGIWSVKP